MIDLEVLKQAVMESRDGITIGDARKKDCPLIFVNPAFERLTGYSFDMATGRNCRYLQAKDRQQPEVAQLRTALLKKEFALVTLRNYRRGGGMFWNELSISPVKDSHGEVTHFIGIQKDVTAKVILSQQLKEQNLRLELANQEYQMLASTDPLTGLNNRRYFDQQMLIQWNIALRTKDHLAVYIVDIDFFKQYNDCYGHLAGDECLIKVSNALTASFRRASDILARFGGEEFVVLATHVNEGEAANLAEQLRSTVADLHIDHERSTVAPMVTVSVGYAVVRPNRSNSIEQTVDAADKALYQAKATGRNRCANA